jgi:hypothetical protein
MPKENYLPRYDYVGPLSQEDEAIAYVDSYLRTNVPNVEAREIRRHEFSVQFTALEDSVEELGEDLGLDLSDRRRGPAYFHVYSEKEYEAVRRQFGLSLGSVAVHSTSGHMLIMQEAKVLPTLGNANHEIIHAMSRKSIRPEATKQRRNTVIIPERSHDGYASFRHGTFNAVNEVITEMTNVDLMRNYWPAHTELRDAAKGTYNNIGYLPQLILLDELLKDHFTDPKQVFKHLQKGMFMGKMGTLRAVNDIVGQDTMRNLALLDAEDSVLTAELAEELGLIEAVRKIEQLGTHNLLTWL